MVMGAMGLARPESEPELIISAAYFARVARDRKNRRNSIENCPNANLNTLDGDLCCKLGTARSKS